MNYSPRKAFRCMDEITFVPPRQDTAPNRMRNFSSSSSKFANNQPTTANCTQIIALNSPDTCMQIEAFGFKYKQITSKAKYSNTYGSMLLCISAVCMYTHLMHQKFKYWILSLSLTSICTCFVVSWEVVYTPDRWPVYCRANIERNKQPDTLTPTAILESPSHVHLWYVGGSQRSLRKPKQAQGERAKSTREGP